jgi:hypothetical protein
MGISFRKWVSWILVLLTKKENSDYYKASYDVELSSVEGGESPNHMKHLEGAKILPAY